MWSRRCFWFIYEDKYTGLSMRTHTHTVAHISAIIMCCVSHLTLNTLPCICVYLLLLEHQCFIHAKFPLCLFLPSLDLKIKGKTLSNSYSMEALLVLKSCLGIPSSLLQKHFSFLQRYYGVDT